MLIYDNIEGSYYEVIPVKKIEEKIKELNKEIEDYLKTDNSGRFTRNNCIMTYYVEALQQLIKENTESEE